MNKHAFLILAALVAGAVMAETWEKPAPIPREKGLYRCQVHRGGGKKSRPDNSLETFLWCWGHGVAPEADARLTKDGCGHLPVCIAKTQYSFTDDPAAVGAPEGFTLTVRAVRLSAGAGFVVALTGDIMTMPGLPKSPAAERIDVAEDGTISGLF